MAKSEQDLLKEIEIIEQRMKARDAENMRDKATKIEIQRQLSSVRAKSMLGAKVVLRSDAVTSDDRLRELNGVPGTVLSVGRSLFKIRFDGESGPVWRLPFDSVAAATPENIALAIRGRLSFMGGRVSR